MFVRPDLRPDLRLEGPAMAIELVVLEDRTGWPVEALADRVRSLGVLADLVHQAIVVAVADADDAAAWAAEGAIHPVPWLCQQVPFSHVDARRLLRVARQTRHGITNGRPDGLVVPVGRLARLSA